MGMRKGFVVSREWSLDDVAAEIWEFEQGWEMESRDALAAYEASPSGFPIQFVFWMNLYRTWLNVTGNERVVLVGAPDSHGALWSKARMPVAL